LPVRRQALQKTPHLPQFSKVPLSFLDHYWWRPSSWTLSGSCPLCLTPPCYHLRAAGNGGSFFCPISGQLRQKAPYLTPLLSLPGNYVAMFVFTNRPQRAMLTYS
jgi:hypothetical protein